MNARIQKPKAERQTHRGFTLIELLVIIGTVAVLAAIVLPALANTKSNGTIFQCLNNQKRLAQAFVLYAADHNDAIVPFAISGGFWGSPSPQLTSGMTAAQAQVAVENGLKTNNVLFPYAPSIAVYHCPGDERYKRTMTTGWAYDSYSKTQNVGGEDWDNYWRAGAVYMKITEIHSASSTLIFMEDADERNRNIGAWALQWMTGGSTFTWVDPPAMYHGDVGTVAFADGHALGHTWKNGLIIAAGKKAASGQAPPGLYPTASTLTGADGAFVHDNYRFPGWK